MVPPPSQRALAGHRIASPSYAWQLATDGRWLGCAVLAGLAGLRVVR